ncbi:MAG: tol-pal system protein YbgF [Myxococcota bacterium]|jgi:tol-pal system protein YbgF
MRSAWLFVMAGLACGCGTSRFEALEKQVTDLNQRLLDVQRAHTSTTVNVEDLEARLFLVQDELDTYRKRSRTQQDLPVVRVRRQKPPAERPAARPPQQRGVHGFDQLTEDGRVIRSGKDEPTPRLKQATSPSAPKPPKLTKAARGAIALYKQSYDHYKSGRFQKAIDGFMMFVESHPNHGHADNAVYWMAECYYTRALWQKALQTFQQVIATYPLGNKAADAMFKMGLCYVQLRDYAQAREVLSQVREIYPNSPVANLASNQLERIP